jgi:hypothetical protein
MDGKRSPCDDENLDQKFDSRDQPAEQRRHQAAISNEWILLNMISTAAVPKVAKCTSRGV